MLKPLAFTIGFFIIQILIYLSGYQVFLALSASCGPVGFMGYECTNNGIYPYLIGMPLIPYLLIPPLILRLAADKNEIKVSWVSLIKYHVISIAFTVILTLLLIALTAPRSTGG